MDRTERHDDSAQSSPDAVVAAAHVHLVFGAPTGLVQPVDQDGIVLGRELASTEKGVQLADARASRRHAAIRRSGASFRLVDLGSRNGGFVDGAAFGPGADVALSDGAVIRIGNSILVFREGRAVTDSDKTLSAFPGRSAAATAVRRRLRALASATGHVLLMGETGTGKERAARFIGAAADPDRIVAINCAELSGDLARAELFGHARGAFSGAATAREGLVDRARDGAIFLDEIGELSLEVQADLLRFMEDGGYRAVGSTELRTSRARVVAATNVVLDDAVREGRFRRDLLARLRAANAPLELPALRDRREDILGWAETFLRELLDDETPAAPWSAGLAECLLLYPWPENLRELRGTVRALASGMDPFPLPATALPARIQSFRRESRAVAPAPTGTQLGEDPSREDIERALAATRGTMRATAEMLGIDRRKLYRLCERLGVDADAYRKDG